MPSIDERVVAMAFENAKFEALVAQTMASLNKLDTALQQIGTKNSLGDIEKSASKVTLQQPMSALDKLKARFSRAGADASDGLNQVEKAGSRVTLAGPSRALDSLKQKLGMIGGGNEFAAVQGASDKVNLGGLNSQIETTKNHFDAMRFAAIVAFGTIVHKATNAGLQMVKAITVQPLIDGFHNYETQINAVQTIMANTGLTGKKGLGQVQKALDELNTYANLTVYNFSEMAKNIGTFTAAGVDLKTATASIKGIANLAALSGSNSQQASTAMYQLSQAIAAGKVGLQDWNSVVNAGMGGKVFQQALANTAQAMGTLKDGSVKAVGPMKQLTINGNSFRQSIQSRPGQKTWLTSDVLTKTLEQFTGDMSEAQLKAEGFSDSQIKAIQAQAKAAVGAATNIKTITQLMQALKEEVASSWGAIFKTLFGDIFSATSVFSKLHNAAQNALTGPVYALNKVLQGWAKLGGRSILIDALKKGMEDLHALIKPIQQAFREIFPAQTPQGLLQMTKSFRNLMVTLKPSASTVDGLRRTFAGLFAVLHIVWSVVKGVIGVIADLLGVVGKGSGGFLNFTGTIGDFLVAVDNALTKGGLLKGFFKGLESVLKVPVSLLGSLASAIGGLFGHVDASSGGKVAGGLNAVKGAATPLAAALDTLKKAWDGFVHILGQAKDLVSPWLDKIGQDLSNIGNVIAQAFQGANFDHVMTALQTGFIGGIFLALKKAIGTGAIKLTSPLKALSSVIGGVTGNLKAMQERIKAGTIFEIAAAIGVLAASILVLSKIDPKALASAMTAIAVGLGELMGAMKLMTGGLGRAGIIEMPIIAASLVGLAASMVILAGAVKIFSTMSWGDLAKGLVGVGGGLAAISLGMKTMGAGTIVQAPALLVLAVALNAIALAVKQFASLNWGELAKGLTGVLGSLVAMISPITAAGPELTLAAPGVIGIALALNMLAGAVLAFGKMDVKTLAKGLIAATIGLGAIGIAMNTIPPHAALLGAGLLIVAAGLTGIAGAVKIFGSMSVGGLAKGLIAMGGSLVILSVGLSAMSGALPGAAALTVAAAALALFAPTLAFLGTLNWSTIFKGMAAVALSLGTLSVAGALAAPGLIALGVALLPLGLAFVTVGAAAYLFAKALALLANDGTKGLGVMIAAITAFVAVLPTIIVGLVKGLLDIVGQIASLAPKIAVALGLIIDTLISVVIKEAPRLAQAIGALVEALLTVIVRDSPKLIQAGITLVLNLLRGIDNNISAVVSRAASIITKFLDGIASQAPALTAAGARFIVSFLNGIANHVGDIVASAAKIELNFIGGLLSLPAKVFGVAVKAIAKFVAGIASGIGNLIHSGVQIVVKVLNGVASAFGKIATTATRFVVRFFNAFGNRENVRRMVNAGFSAAINVLNGIADGIKNHDNLKRVIDAAVNVGVAIVEGVAKGLASLPGKLGEKLLSPLKSAVGTAKSLLDIGSPSKVFIKFGQWIVDGMAIGLGGMGIALSTGITKPLHAMLAANKDMKAFGQFLGGEFRTGLTGGLWNDGKSDAQKQIEGAFTALKTKLGEEQQKLRDGVKSDEDKLNQLLDAKDKDWGQIKALETRIAQEKIALLQSSSASNTLIANMRGEQSALIQLAAQYTDLATQLDAAKQHLDQLKQDQLQAVQDYAKQFDTLPDINSLVDDAISQAQMTSAERWDAIRKKQEEDQQKASLNQVALYKQALQQQILDTQKYMDTLGKLRAAGLDDQTYKKLLDMGTAGQQFASQLLSSGPQGIKQINDLDAQLAQKSMDLAQNAAHQLYDAGIKAAEGLVKGLQDKQDAIRHTMEDIARSMIGAIKKSLGIKSPSQVFAELGQFSAQGFADGLVSSSNLVQDAATAIGSDAADALTKSLANVSDRVQNGINTDITITPVLDLTQVQKDASKIQDLSNVVPITAAASYGQASAISEETQARSDAAQASGGDTIIDLKLEQNNTSPKALDDIEIYRQTKNQLSQVKGALGLATKPKP
jgi:tape measure domain-containing protein